MTKQEKVMAIHRYYRITKFYGFLKNITFKGGLSILIIVGVLILLEYFFIDINAILNGLVEDYSPRIVFSVFLLSETILGLLPPEIFIAWSSKSATPWLFLFLLATASYLGGIISYLLGKQLFRIPSLRFYLEHKIAKHIEKLRKWGGFFVVVGAMLPLPHSIVSLACGLIKYNFRSYLFWALFRYARFVAYALVIFKIY